MENIRTATIFDHATQSSKIVEITRNYPTGEVGRWAKDVSAFIALLSFVAFVAMACVAIAPIEVMQ